MKLILLTASLISLLIISTCLAGGESVKVALHVRAHNAKQSCANLPVIEGCGDINATYAGCGDVDVFTVFFDFDGCTGAHWGLTWPAEWGSGATTHCGDLSIGGIVDPGDWVAVTYMNCQPGPVIVVAWTWLMGAWSPGVVYPVAAPPEWPFAGITDCDFVEWEAVCTFGAGICGACGDDPCGPSATEAATWGTVKSMFR